MSDSQKLIEDKRTVEDPEGYFDSKFRETPVYIGPGNFECTMDPNIMLISNVGSGVVMCIHDPEIKVGGLVHLLLPGDVLKSFPKLNPEDAGVAEIEELIERFIRALKVHGAGKNRIKIRLFGGTSILDEFADSGLMNFIFAKEYLLRKGLMVGNVDVGGKDCRRIQFHAVSGKAERIKLRRKQDTDLLRAEEKAYLAKITQRP